MVWVFLSPKIFYLQTKRSNCQTYWEFIIQLQLTVLHCLSAVLKQCCPRNYYLFKLFGRMDSVIQAFYHYFLLSNTEPAIQNHTQTSEDIPLLECSLFPVTNFIDTQR